MDNHRDSNLFAEFPQHSREEWEAAIKKDLKGSDYAKKLIWKSPEGFDVKPYYRQDDLRGKDQVLSLPGEYPFVRGNKASTNAWNIRQDIYVDDIAKANKKALSILMKGVNALGFIFDEKPEPTLENIEGLCENIFADAVELNFSSLGNELQIVEHINTLVKKYNRDFDKIYGSVDFDPLGNFAINGNFPTSADGAFDQALKMIRAAQNLPHFKVLIVNGKNFHNSGSTLSQELAFALAQGVNYLTQLTERGLSINEIAPRIQFQFATGGNYFMEIAKHRAARMLWAQIVKAYGPAHEEACQMFIHATTSNWNKTVYDPYVNMLRSTTESMASIIGGADTLTVNPFDSVFEEPTEFSERIARNQQLLLKEESHFDKVADPSAGSYYIEELTSSIARKAWSLFLEVQEKGGFLEAFRRGFIQAQIKESARNRDMRLMLRKDILLGTNEYPNGDEKLNEELDEKVFFGGEVKTDETEAEPLTLYRGAQAFEQLRRRTELYAKKNRTPRVFLFAIGNLSMRMARAQFTANFFNCAGFEVITNSGFQTIEEGLNAWKEQEAEITVVCSSDEEYAAYAPQISEQLAKKSILVIAGNPVDQMDTLKKFGFENFIHVCSNIIEVLSHFQKQLGIE